MFASCRSTIWTKALFGRLCWRSITIPEIVTCATWEVGVPVKGADVGVIGAGAGVEEPATGGHWGGFGPPEVGVAVNAGFAGSVFFWELLQPKSTKHKARPNKPMLCLSAPTKIPQAPNRIMILQKGKSFQFKS